MTFWDLVAKSNDFAAGVVLVVLVAVVGLSIILYRFAESWGERGRGRK